MEARGLRAVTAPPLHTYEPLRRTALNRIFIVVYISAIIALLYRHAQTLVNYTTTSLLSFSLNLLLLIADLLLAFMWIGAQAFRVRPIRRKEFPENLKKVIKEEDYPGLDVLICTADPCKEPPMNVVSTALSLMAYIDYPAEKISVYVSDDGGSALTLFAFMEAAKFASYWLPFCREQNIMERSPKVYFASNNNISWSPEFEKIKRMYEDMKEKVEHVVDKGEISDEYIIDNPHSQAFKKWTKGFTPTDHPAVIQVATMRTIPNGDISPTKIEKIKTMYENMKVKVENVVDRGEISEEYITNDEEREAFNKWTDGFTSIDHPAVIQVILDKSKDKDITGKFMPNLIYVSRQKSKTSPHHFKAGALNVLLRVSAVMSNAPIILTQDCDMHSNDPITPLRVICYMLDPAIRSEVAYIQFPQRFYGLSKNDIYALEYKRVFQIHPMGFDGLKGPYNVGSGTFFNRRALFGSPSTLLPPEIPELNPSRISDKPIKSQAILALAHNVASCYYENNTQWGCKIGFRYGSLVEDFYTGYQLHCEGWRSLFCHPERAAFLGGMPVTLIDLLVQSKRWCLGLFDVGFCKYNPLVFGYQRGNYTPALPFHTVERLPHTALNRLFAAVYACAILALLYHHAQTLLHSTTLVSFLITFSLLVSDLVLAFMWATSQAFRMNPVRREQFPENLKKKVKEQDFPKLDVFICTADPYKEPPMGVVNTALSLMAYDYPTEKISVYVSDDGGSALTLFAFMEASKFASYWLPFCRENNIMDRSPSVYFSSTGPNWTPEAQNIKEMYENMKVRVENVVNRGEVSETYITNDEEREAFKKWTCAFTPRDHPTVIQVLLDSSKDTDITGHFLPNLIYVSRQKIKTSPHHFKAGALNVLLRVSTIMTNAPIILTQDCDMYSNDPQTPLKVLCYVFDSVIEPNLGFVQFPQRFTGVNKDDTYGCEYKHLAVINPMGIDGLRGPYYCGTGTFFRRRALFGDPSTCFTAEILELNPDHTVNKPIKSPDMLALAHHVASCSFENDTEWGSKMGFRYGSLVEDFFTGFRLHCDGWRSVFCNPERAAFLGNAPINLSDVLNQCKRWAVGLLEMGFSEYSPITFGTRSIGLMGLGYSHYSFWPLYAIPVTIYSFLPQLALLNGVSVFPKISEPWFFLYLFLFLGAYGQDFIEYVLEGASFRRWWNAQRMWMIRKVSSFSFGTVEYLLKSIGLSAPGFNVTSKVVDDEQNKRYGQGIFEFGVPSPLFVPLTMAAIINLFSLAWVTISAFSGNYDEGLFLQMLLAGCIVLNYLPIYEAIALRSDKGKMPTKITIIATFLAGALYTATLHCFKVMKY
ncbi:Cellulose synthase [Corchorus capsularis]|uniref:Cellulose synthase n=1 Tax=Corchorus capsularis TaxID=210143 RepID=A0A1R3IB34_COCAP|nr:Cellulose synthase [Corchorus capsularis]